MAKNVLHFGKRAYVRTHQDAYADLDYWDVPFDCDPALDDADLRNRLAWAVMKRYPAKNGFACDLHAVTRNGDNGVATLRYYHGLGD